LNYESIIGNPIITGIITGLIVIGFVNIVKYGYKEIISLVNLNDPYTISGIWATNYYHWADSTNSLEVVKIIQRKEKISIYYQHFRKTKTNCMTHGIGEGFFRTSELYMSYGPLEKERGGGGVLMLRLKDKEHRKMILEGLLLEFDRTPNQSLNANSYSLHRVRLPIWQKIKFWLRKPCFDSYEKASDYLESKLKIPITPKITLTDLCKDTLGSTEKQFI